MILAESTTNTTNFTGGVTLIGTEDTFSPPETVDNYYMHELGHILGAIHPSSSDGDGTRFAVESGTGGVMCKSDCLVNFGAEQLTDVFNGLIVVAPGLGSPVRVEELEGQYISSAMRFSDANEFRILNLDYDQKDESEDESGFEPPGGENPDRNITSVATAATGKSK